MRLRILADLYAHDEALFAYAEHAIRAVGMPLGARGLRLTLTLEQVMEVVVERDKQDMLEMMEHTQEEEETDYKVQYQELQHITQVVVEVDHLVIRD